MRESYQQRGVENPTIVDLVTTDGDRREVVLVMLEPRPWLGSRQQLLQLEDKLDSYFTYVLDGHLVQQYPQYADHSVRLQLDCIEEPGPGERELLRAATRFAQGHGLKLWVRKVRSEDIPPAPWEEPPPGARWSYRPGVLEQLVGLGVRPRERTSPSRVRRLLTSLYLWEAEEARLRHRELDRHVAPQGEGALEERLAAVRHRYTLLALPLERWTEEESEAGTGGG